MVCLRSSCVQRRGIALHTPGPWTIDDDLSVTQAAHLDTTLRGHLPVLLPDSGPARGKVAAPGSHFVFFNHALAEHELDEDGYDNLQAPLNITDDESIVLRRWYGGTVEFNLDGELRLGEPAECIETVEDVRAGPRGHRVAVTIARHMRNKGAADWAIKETRSLFYLGARSRLLEGAKRLKAPRIEPEYTPLFQQELVASRTLLFRYSALTFNAHRIHWDRDYARECEGLDDVIVQGPLMITLLLRWLADSVLGASGRRIHQLSYRNIAPIAVGERVTLCATHITANTMEVWITGGAGTVALTGTLSTS